MFARDVMTPEAEWIAPDLLLAEVGRIMRDKCIGCLPVGENDRLIGIITDRDLPAVRLPTVSIRTRARRAR